MYDASTKFTHVSLSFLNFHNTEGITVRRSGVVNGSALSQDANGGGGYTWTITFPLTARNAQELGVDGAALEGSGAAGNLVQTRMARSSEIQRVSTSASSEIYGGFQLGFNGEKTDQLPYNATADEVKVTAEIIRVSTCESKQSKS